MTEEVYAKPIRILHSLLALCILTQLAVGELMDVPEVEDESHTSSISLVTEANAHENHTPVILSASGEVEESLGFEVHEFLGLFIGALLLMRILLAMTSLPGANWRNLVPWLFAEGRCALLKESKQQMAGWKQGKLASPEEGETLARSVHGLIVLLAIVMGATGCGLYFGWSTTAPQTEWVEFVAEIHELTVGLLEAVLAAHILAVILHQRQGHNIVARIKPV